MRRYLVQRLALLPLVVLGVSLAVFLLVRLLPGDVVTVLTREAPQYGAAGPLRHQLGLDRPLPAQFVRFVGGALHGDFGDSLYFRRPIADDLRRALPVTLELAVLAVLVSAAIAVPAAVLSATRSGGAVDRAARVLSVALVATPTFWLATVSLTALALWAHWTPPLRYTPLWQNPAANLEQFVLPAIVLGCGSAGLLFRIVRAQLLEVLAQEYVRTGRAKGLRERTVLRRHALRNACVPAVAMFGNQLGVLLGGAVVTETVFNLPGLGRLLLDGITNRDYPTVQAAVLIIALALVTLNLAVDLVYAWLDPRIRYAR